jgi:CarD family transcriptional regulator
MPFDVGDRVVHPYHGPGRIASIEQKELLDGPKRYYVIDVPTRALTVQIPVGTTGAVGLRKAMAPSTLPKVLRTLRSQPSSLPEDYKERQELVAERLNAGRVMQLAEVVRDLNWHRDRLHLTKRDEDLLKQGQDMLAAEMALVSGEDVSEAVKLIESTMAAALERPAG